MSQETQQQIQIERLSELNQLYGERLHQLEKRAAVAGVTVDPSVSIEIEQIRHKQAAVAAELETLRVGVSEAGNGPRPNLVRSLLAEMQRPQTLTEWVPPAERPAKHRGLILLIGIGRPGEDPMSQSAGDAITYHLALKRQEVGLERCWFIASAGAQGSEAVAGQLQQVCREKFGLETEILTVSDPFNVQETYEVVEHIYHELVPQAGLNETEVIADFTGGVKPMSAGMILACGSQRPMQYYTGRKAGIASLPRIIKFSPRTGA